MHRSFLMVCWIAVCLSTSVAYSGDLTGPIIKSVDWDAVRYLPGSAPLMTMVIKPAAERQPANNYAVATVTVRDIRGTEILNLEKSLKIGTIFNQKISFRLHAPASDFSGYFVSIVVKSSQGVVLDSASGAFDVASQWNRFPRYCFVSGSSVVAGQAIEATISNLVSYRCNAIQWYDVNWKHHQPYANAQKWPNIGGIIIDRATLKRGLDIATKYHIVNFDYQLWNGAWDGYNRDESNTKETWALYRKPCGQHCTLDVQLKSGPFPDGWATRWLYQMDASNPEWQRHWLSGEKAVLHSLRFDGVQIDTLGDPGSVVDVNGNKVILGNILSYFSVLAHDVLHSPVIMNPVSAWNIDHFARHGSSEVIYTEIHPEFGNFPFYPSLNGLVAHVHSLTNRQIVIAAYMETLKGNMVGCHTSGGSKVCSFSSAGVRYVDSQMLASGINHWELGDINSACSTRQAKLTSNIYVSGPALCMDSSLQEWMQDAKNFEVGYEIILRDQVVDAPDVHVAAQNLPRNIILSTNGAAGTIYTMVKENPSFTIVHFLNYSALESIRLDDPHGDYPMPIEVRGLKVLISGIKVAPRTVWLATPDRFHGSRQPLRWSMHGTDLEILLPQLEFWDMLVIEKGVSGSGGTKD